jgi:hypothetical protein
VHLVGLNIHTEIIVESALKGRQRNWKFQGDRDETSKENPVMVIQGLESSGNKSNNGIFEDNDNIGQTKDPNG